MPVDHRTRLANIRRFDQLIAYLRDEMGWPIDSDDFEELTFEYTPEELGIDAKNAAKIQEIKRLRPLAPGQPWGIFFVKFEPKRLPVVALRRILGQVALKKRASANKSERQAWAADDLLFVSNYGEGEERRIAFAHFSKPPDGHDLPTLKVLGWDNLDTPLHLDAVARKLTDHLAWPDDEDDPDVWRDRWRAAFTLRHREVITTSKQLSERLAELARAIRDRIKTALAIETEAGPLTQLMKAFQTSLVHDLDEAGFADMYAQTIAYGLLSARITDPGRSTADDFAAHMRTNPFLRELMDTFLHVGGRRGKAGGPGIDFDELGVSEVVELLNHPKTNMEAVVRDFGDRNPQEDPVIHFYEHFLAAYDKKQKVSRGVFYTPRPVVSYIVRSVDELLRTEFGLEDGLADTTTWGEMAKRREDLEIPDGTSSTEAFVQILDPATGTGTFLVEVIDLIHETMVDRWKAQCHGEKKIQVLWNEYVPKHLLSRLHGYELLMAPYAIAHLKIGLKLHETGYAFGADERARVYLTNALEPASDTGQLHLEGILPALAHEARAVNKIKRTQRFTVAMGNPPYSKLSQNKGEWIDALMDRYKTTIRSQEIQRQALSNDYVKFVCFASTLLEPSGACVLGMITDNSYLDGPLFRDMRADLMATYPTIQLADLGGNSRRSEATPEDQNVFDIQQGVAVLLGTTTRTTDGAGVRYVAVRGSREDKAAWLIGNTTRSATGQELRPREPQYFFIPYTAESAHWTSWPPLPEIFAGGLRRGRPLPFNGAALATRHDFFAIAFTEDEIRDNLRLFFDESETRESLDQRFRLCSSAHFDFEQARSEVTIAEAESCIQPILYRPFDTRFVVYHPLMIGESRPDVMKHVLAGKLALLSTRRVTGRPYDNVFVCRGLVEYKATTHDRNTQVFPLYLDESGTSESFFTTADGEERRMNISASVFADWRKHVGTRSPEDLLAVVYAVLHSPSYRRRFRENLQQDYARVPWPRSPELGRELATFGTELIALHLIESPILQDTITTYSGPDDPVVARVGWSDGTVWLDAHRTNAREGHRATKAGTTGFEGVPEEVWDFNIGGYQVCHKWLKDRRGRTLSAKDVAHYQKIVVALNETIRIMSEIDEAIEAHGGWPGAFLTVVDEKTTKSPAPEVVPFRPPTVDPQREERYVTCVPLVPLEAAAGTFSDPQHADDGGFDWVAVGSRRKLGKGMFVAQVVGQSMEPAIPDGAWCLFRSPVQGARQGKTVLVQLRDATDPETGHRYTVKRYESEKAEKGDSWGHERIVLRPVNPDFEPIVLTDASEGEFQVIAELVEVLEANE